MERISRTGDGITTFAQAFVESRETLIERLFWFSQLHPASPSSVNTTVDVGRQIEYDVIVSVRTALAREGIK